MTHKLLVSPAFPEIDQVKEGGAFGRSFYREDLGYGVITSQAGVARSLFGKVRFLDSKGFAEVEINVEVEPYREPYDLLNDLRAETLMSHMIDSALSEFDVRQA